MLEGSGKKYKRLNSANANEFENCDELVNQMDWLKSPENNIKLLSFIQAQDISTRTANMDETEKVTKE